MNNKSNKVLISGLLFFMCFISKPAYAGLAPGQIPQIPAFLPYSMDVAMSERYPVDGEWVINTIRKRIRIEAGRAYAVDSWLHLFVLKIEPLMVVIKDIQRTGPGEYSGYDLPLMGAWTAKLLPDGTLNVNVAGTLGPVSYKLMPVRLDNPVLFEQEKGGQYTQPTPDPIMTPTPPPEATPIQPPAETVKPDLANCQQLDVNDAGEIVCLD